MPDTIVVGIDPGMTTGWAVNDNGQLKAGVWDLKAHDEMHPLNVLYDRMHELLFSARPVLLCYEEPVARGMAARSLNRQMGVIILCCELMGISHYPVNPGTLKKHATGKGNATKEEMAAVLPGNLQSTDHNAIDAAWLADYGQRVVLPSMETHE